MVMFSCFGQHHFSNGKCNFRGKEGDEFTPKVGIFKHSIRNNQIGELNEQMLSGGFSNNYHGCVTRMTDS